MGGLAVVESSWFLLFPSKLQLAKCQADHQIIIRSAVEVSKDPGGGRDVRSVRSDGADRVNSHLEVRMRYKASRPSVEAVFASTLSPNSVEASGASPEAGTET
ncbi:hypothetical protein PABG_12432 [Paracoccidioides brasiliensis Pb03]|nr:hypothetical protein PABG_12432 [Paracoccidioides brasiliensis Pb03]